MASPAREVTLREVDRRNVRTVCDLQLAPGQERYVAPNAQTLAEAACDPRVWVRAIYADDEPIGLLALVIDAEEPRYFLVRMMIAAAHQRQGYGRAAIAGLAEHVRSLPRASELETSCMPGHGSPRGFYETLGFVDTGRVWHGETLLTLAL